MSSGSSGRLKGTQNGHGHYAGGSRIGAGQGYTSKIKSDLGLFFLLSASGGDLPTT